MYAIFRSNFDFLIAASQPIFKQTHRTFPLAVPNDQHGGDIM
jgi:hypothetical protein